MTRDELYQWVLEQPSLRAIATHFIDKELVGTREENITRLLDLAHFIDKELVGTREENITRLLDLIHVCRGTQEGEMRDDEGDGWL